MEWQGSLGQNMTIPRSIGREHILAALREIDSKGVPPDRNATKYYLVEGGRSYPPKYVISLAAGHATAQLLPSDRFNGGAETNGFLRKRGFIVFGPPSQHPATTVDTRTTRGTGPRVSGPPGEGESATGHARTTRQAGPRAGHNDEHCGACKNGIAAILRQLYGEIRERASLGVPARLSGFIGHRSHAQLSKIHSALCAHRGFTDFAQSEMLRPVDFFVPSEAFVLEVDEKQHFTYPRAIALRQYASDLQVGFDLQRWIHLCEQIAAHDPTPPDRDEQRAWYDSIRDHLSLLDPKITTTCRLRASDYPWCSLDPASIDDRALLRDWAGLPSRIAVRRATDPHQPYWARIIMHGPWYGGPIQARRVLSHICNEWPTGKHARLMVTCGGFLSFPWPGRLRRADIGDVLDPDSSAMEILFSEADSAVRSLLGHSLLQNLSACSDAITLGVDTLKPRASLVSERINDFHAEFVYLVDLRSGTIIHRTGKSYPTPAQATGLLRVNDLTSHFMTFGTDSVLLLGCHDLTLFNPRGNAAAGGWRAEVIREMQSLVSAKRPNVIVHHPHTTDSCRTWDSAWSKLRGLTRDDSRFASAGRYYNAAETPPRSSLPDVLRSTVCGESLDFVVTLDPQ